MKERAFGFKKVWLSLLLIWFLLVGKRIVAYLAAHRLWAAFFFTAALRQRKKS